MIAPVLITLGVLGLLYSMRPSQPVAGGMAPAGGVGGSRERVPSRPLSEVDVGYEVIVPFRTDEPVPEFRIPGGTHAAILRVDDVSAMNVSGPIIGYTTQPNYAGSLIFGLLSFGALADRRAPFNVLMPPAGPVTVRRSVIERVYPPGTLDAEIRKAGAR